VAAPDNKKKVCQTIIPKDWSQFTGPEFSNGMTVSQANAEWRRFLRTSAKVGPTPKVYR
jgi:hypothetical protein